MDQPAPTIKGLPSIKDLFVNSFNQFTAYWKLLFWTLFLPIIVSLALVLIIGIIIATILVAGGGDFTPARLPLIIPPAIVGVIGLFIVGSVGKIALIKAIKLKGQTTIRQLIKFSWPLVFKYILLQLLLVSVILLGLILFVIPGLIFIIIFMFSTIILVVEGVGGISALKRSHFYVRGKFWKVTGRIIVPVLIMIILAVIFSSLDNAVLNVVYQLISTFVLAPIIMIYTFLLYQGVKSNA